MTPIDAAAWLASALIVFSLSTHAADDPTQACNSTTECNRKGTAAYQSKDYVAASEYFARQIDFAETRLFEANRADANQTEGDRAEAGGEKAAASAARNLAINNAALAELQAGECRKADAFLSIADADHRGTQANRRAWQKGCAAMTRPESAIGDYWQYAGHGAWNKIVLRPTGDETLSLEAFWMRIARGPLDLYGLAAFGEMRDVAVFVDGAKAFGRYDGITSDAECAVSFNLADEWLDVQTTQTPDCDIGGAGALLQGRYRRVSIQPSTNSEQN